MFQLTRKVAYCLLVSRSLVNALCTLCAMALFISLVTAQKNVVSLSRSFDIDGDGFSENGGDCDDTDDDVNPAAIEQPGDGIDNDCDGSGT